MGIFNHTKIESSRHEACLATTTIPREQVTFQAQLRGTILFCSLNSKRLASELCLASGHLSLLSVPNITRNCDMDEYDQAIHSSVLLA